MVRPQDVTITIGGIDYSPEEFNHGKETGLVKVPDGSMDGHKIAPAYGIRFSEPVSLDKAKQVQDLSRKRELPQCSMAVRDRSIEFEARVNATETSVREDSRYDATIKLLAVDQEAVRDLCDFFELFSPINRRSP